MNLNEGPSGGNDSEVHPRRSGGTEATSLRLKQPCTPTPDRPPASGQSGAIGGNGVAVLDPIFRWLKVAAVLPNGREKVIWEGAMEASAENELVSFGFLANAGIKARSVKVYLDTAKVPGWNEIDAVQLRGRDGSTQWASASSASTSYADP